MASSPTATTTVAFEGRARAFLLAAFLAPLLGWIPLLVLVVLAASGRRVLGDAIVATRTDAGARALFVLAAVHATVVIVSDVGHGSAAQGLRSLRVLLPLCLPFVGYGLLRRTAFGLPQLSRWSARAVTVAFVVLLVEWCVFRYLVPGVGDGRARALSANSLFVSAMLVPMVLLAWIDPGPGERRFFASRLATTAMGLIGVVVFTASRTSTITLLALLPAVLWYLGRAGRLDRRATLRIAFGLAVALPLLAVLAVAHSEATLARFRGLYLFLSSFGADLSGDEAIRLRWTHWSAAWSAFVASPWLGYGFANEARTIASHLPGDVASLSRAHQQYLSFALGGGVAGLAAGLALMLAPLAAALRTAPRSPHAVYAACCLWVPFAVNGLTDTLFDDLRIQAFYLIVSLLVIAALGAGGAAQHEDRAGGAHR